MMGDYVRVMVEQVVDGSQTKCEALELLDRYRRLERLACVLAQALAMLDPKEAREVLELAWLEISPPVPPLPPEDPPSADPPFKKSRRKEKPAAGVLW